MKSLTISESLKNKKGVASTLINIGVIYSEQKEYLKAEEYYQKSLKTYQELKIRRYEALVINNIANTYSYRSNVETKRKRDSLLSISINYSFQSLKIYREIKLKKG